MFKSGKMQSGRAGSSGQSNTGRVRSAGMMGGSSRRKRGSEFQEILRLSPGVVSAITLTSASITFGTNHAGDGVIWWIIDTNPLTPSTAQIKAGLEQAGGAADDDGTGVAATPFVAAVSGLAGSTQYFFHAYQEGVDSDSAIQTTIVNTAAFTLSAPGSNTLAATTANVTCTSDGIGGTAYVVVDEDGTPPTAAQIKAGDNSLGAAADFAGNTAGIVSTVIGATGLTTATLYNLYYVTEGANGVFSNIVTNTFTTA